VDNVICPRWLTQAASPLSCHSRPIVQSAAVMLKLKFTIAQSEKPMLNRCVTPHYPPPTLTHVFSSLNRPSQKFRPPWTSPLTRSPYLLPCNPLCLSQCTNNHPRPWRPRNPTFHNNLRNSHDPIDTPLPCAIFHRPTPHHMKEIQSASSLLCGAKPLTYRMHCQPKARHPPLHTPAGIEDSSCQLHHCCAT